MKNIIFGLMAVASSVSAALASGYGGGNPVTEWASIGESETVKCMLVFENDGQVALKVYKIKKNEPAEVKMLIEDGQENLIKLHGVINAPGNTQLFLDEPGAAEQQEVNFMTGPNHEIEFSSSRKLKINCMKVLDDRG